MPRLWPWSSGAPIEHEHSELEEAMSPDLQIENAAYDLSAASRQATAGEPRTATQAGADSQRASQQPR
jgi:hypothetical protein